MSNGVTRRLSSQEITVGKLPLASAQINCKAQQSNNHAMILRHRRDVLHLPRIIHACVGVVFPVLVSVLGRFVSNSRHSKLVDIRSEDVLSPLRGGLYAKARRSLSFESSFRIIHCLTLLSLLLLPFPVLPNQNPAP